MGVWGRLRRKAAKIMEREGDGSKEREGPPEQLPEPSYYLKVETYT